MLRLTSVFNSALMEEDGF